MKTILSMSSTIILIICIFEFFIHKNREKKNKIKLNKLLDDKNHIEKINNVLNSENNEVDQVKELRKKFGLDLESAVKIYSKYKK